MKYCVSYMMHNSGHLLSNNPDVAISGERTIFAVFWNATSLNWVKGNEPNAVIVHLDKSLVDAERSVRTTGVTVCLAIFLRCKIPARFQFYYHGPDKAGYTVCDR